MSPAPAILDPRASTTLDDFVLDVAWSPDGAQLAVLGGEGGVYIADVAQSILTATQIGTHLLGGLALAWQPKKPSFVTSGQDGHVIRWSSETRNETGRIGVRGAPTQQLAWSNDGKRLATAAGKTLSVWADDATLLHRNAGHASSIAALCWDKPARDLAAATHGAIVIHRFDKTVSERQLKWPASCMTAAFSPNGKFLASGMGDGAVHFWYLSNARDSQMRGYPGKVLLTIWSDNSRYLATGAGNEVVVWDFGGKGPEGSRPLQLSGHTERVTALAWQSNGPHLVSGGDDWRLSLWQPGKATRALDAHLTGAAITALRWSPDGKLLAVGEKGGALAVYALVAA